MAWEEELKGVGVGKAVDEGKKKKQKRLVSVEIEKEKISPFLSFPVNFFHSPAPRMQLTSAKVAPQGADRAEEEEEEAPRER